MPPKPKSVEEYISQFPADVQEILIDIRKKIKTLAPQAEEGISYGIVGYKLQGKPLVYFAGYKNHIGLYATPSGHHKFSEELSIFKQGKGSVQFPLSQKIPLDLIGRIVEFKISEILAK